ncbi:MAG: guanylate kinase [Lachnospiraceae bacterium]
MGKIFCIMGKSSTGKDSIYRHILCNASLDLKRLIPYTTRPIRVGETDGVEYVFVNDERLIQLQKEEKIIELREYMTIAGIWRYFTVNDGQIDLDHYNYLLIGTLESFLMLKQHFGAEIVIPIYIEVEDGDRLARALKREKKQAIPGYEEMCRRFLADQADFSEERLKAAGITRRFQNADIQDVVQEITVFIEESVCDDFQTTWE